MLHTTFNLCHKSGACTDRYKHLAKALGGVKKYGENTLIPLTVVLEHNGLDDTLWALRCVLTEETAARDKLDRFFTCDCAERVLPLFEKKYPDDQRPRQAIEIARLFAAGKATAQELDAASDAARAAASDAASDAARAAERTWQSQHLQDMLIASQSPQLRKELK